MLKNGRMKMNDIKKMLDLYLKAGLGPRMIAGALNKSYLTFTRGSSGSELVGHLVM